MAELTFDILNRAWNKMKTEKATELRRQVPGLSDPQPIYLKRASEDMMYLQVEFRDIEKAVLNPARDVPMVKKMIVNWVKSFATDAQLVRSGDTPSLVLRLSKTTTLPRLDQPQRKMAPAASTPDKYAQQPQVSPRGLTHIMRKKPVAA